MNSMIDKEKVIEVQDLCYAHRHQWTLQKVSILKNVSFEVHAGEVFGFLGKNGAGKTTTIKCLLGLITPTSGIVRLLGKNHSDPSARAKVGYVPEQPYFYDNLSIEEIMNLYATLSGVPKHTREEAVTESLKRLDLLKRRRSKMRSLSKGLSQRVALAQAIVARPRLLILDEPFSGLDPIGRREFKNIFFELKEGGATLFMSTHVLADVEHLCDRALILREQTVEGVYNLGDIVVDESEKFEVTLKVTEKPLDSLQKRADSSRVEGPLLHCIVSGRGSAESFVQSAINEGHPLVQFRSHHKSLEDLFIETVTAPKR
jgi:ABC-2 type transport system ATP-binding protein